MDDVHTPLLLPRYDLQNVLDELEAEFLATEAQKRLEPLLDEIGKTLDTAQLEPDMVLAVIAELAQRHIQDDGERDVTATLSKEKEA